MRRRARALRRLAVSLTIAGALVSSTVRAAPPAADPDADADAPEVDEAEPAPEPRPMPKRTPAPTPPTPTVSNEKLWSGLVGYDLVLSIDGRSVLRGHLIGQYADGLVFARDRDGEVVVVPYARVTRAHVDLEAKYGMRLSSRIDNGKSFIAWGAVLLAFGTPTLTAGIVFTSITPTDLYLTLPMLLTGGPLVIGGTALLAVGIERRNYWREATDRSDRLGFGREIQPMLDRTVFEF